MIAGMMGGSANPIHPRRGSPGWVRIVVIATLIAMVAAACGGDSAEETTTTAAEAPATTGDTETTDTVATTGAETSTTTTAGNGDPEEGALVIDGEVIADAELYQAALEEGRLVPYFSYPEAITAQLVEQFSEDTGIETELVRLSTPVLYERIQTEFGADVLEADVISLTEFSLIQQLVEDGILDSYMVPNFDEIPDDLKDPEGYWYGEIGLVSTIVYNNEIVTDPPASWAELLDEQWQGQIGFNHVGSGGFSWTTFLFLREMFGEEYWQGLADLDPLLSSGVGSLTEQLVRGEIAISINHLGTAKNAIRDGAPLTIVYPEEGVPFFVEWLGLASTTQNPNAARVYLNWAMSKRGGDVIAELSGEYPPNPASNAPADSPSIEELNGWIPPIDLYLNEREEGVARWNEIFEYVPEG